ncbi:hypothetical protein Aperf_G00000072039 [Anoplocephala perfoliata]
MDAQILFVFKVGHKVYRRPNPTVHKTHHWRCTVESWSDQFPLSKFVNNVVFQLHETFKNPRQVVTKEPFSIEEDGFGNFLLLATVSFLNVITDLQYDITLHDDRELYSFRTVRLEPKNYDEWIRFTQYGGIPIPKSATSYDIQQTVMEPIQSSGANCTLPISCFYPELTAAILGQAFKHSSPNSLRSRPNRECRNQALANLGLPIINESPAPNITSSASTSGRYPLSLMSSSFKHKKKLQLKHEAQLRLENQNQTEFIIPSSSPSSSRPPTAIGSWPASATACSEVVQQPDRIVLRLFRSDIVDKKKNKSKKKHKNHHHRNHRQNEASDENLAQQHQLANRLEEFSSKSPSDDVASYIQSPHNSLDRGEEGNQYPPSSFSIFSKIEGALPYQPLETGVGLPKVSPGAGNQRVMEPTEGFPQTESQHATMVWVSQLEGGPAPLVSPLPPSHAGLGFNNVPPLLSQQPQMTSEQKDPKSHLLKDSKHRRRNKDVLQTSKNGEVSPPSSSRREIVHRSVDEEMKEGSRSRDVRQSSGMKFALSSDSTPPMSAEAAPPPESAPQPAPQTSEDMTASVDAYFDNEELERLFDRLLGLKHESMALKLAEILRRYSKPGDANSGVNEIDLPDSYPSVIAFDLRRVPLACVFEMADVVLTDEQMAASPS